MKYRFLLIFFFPVNLFAQSFIYTSKPALIGVGNSSAITFDADNDGKTDLLVMGKNGVNCYTKLYHNNGDTTFLDLGIPFPGLAFGSVDVLDYNNDGLLDIVLCGFDGVNKRFCLYKNKGSNLFSEASVGVAGVDYSTVKCADINRDGLTDIVIMGQSATQKIFKIYKNNGNGTFTEVNSLEGLYDGSFVIADINKDTYPDIIASGVNSSEIVSKIYLNSGKNNFSFTERASNITAIRGGDIKNIDFDNDGDNDILVTGKAIDDEYITQIFKNNSGESFTLFATLNGLFYASSTTGDFNNDGYVDVVLAGLDASSVYKSFYYKNDSGLGFTEQSTNLPSLIKGSINPLNLTNDSKLDIVIGGFKLSGPVTYAYNNDIAAINTRPNAPYNLSSYSRSDSVELKWNRPNDTETQKKGLTYDFYIKQASDGDTVFTSPSSYLTGDRHVYKQGGLQDTSIMIRKLPYGKYYWSVQAVDQGYKGSEFAPPAEFNICNNLDIGRDTSICKGNSITLSAGTSADDVNWYSSENPSISFYSGNNSTIEVSKNLKVWATVSTSIGCVLTDTIHLSALSLPITSLKNDTTVCIYTPLSLTLFQSNYMGDWSSKGGSITAFDTSSIGFNVMRNDTVYVKITDTNGCIIYDTTRVFAHPLPERFLPPDTSICFHDTLHLKGANVSDSLYWFDSKGYQLSDKNELSHYVSNSEKLTARIVSPFKCTNFDTVSVIMLTLPSVDAGRDTIICPNSSARLGGMAQSGSFTYDWSPAQLLNDFHAANPFASPETTTEYILKITDSHSCINYDSVTVTINSESTINSGGDKFICIGSSILLGGNPIATGSILPYSYKWYPDANLDNDSIANPAANPDSTTQYSLIISAGKCIVDTIPVKVTVWPLPVITKSDDVTIGYLENTQIWATGGSQYNWEPTAGLDNSTTSNPIASPETTTTYTVFVVDTNGCKSSAQVLVTVQNSIFVPNLFTPNGDGKNDFFMMYGTGIDRLHLRIYSSDGIMVYETSNVEDATSKGWDGTYRGTPLSAGKYLWVLDVTSTEGKALLYNGSNKGVITLLR